MRRRALMQSGKSSGVYDENLVYDDTNIEAKFPNANSTGIDSTGNVLVATADSGEAISILKSQDNDTTGITPTMTTSTTPSGVVTESNSINTTYGGWAAFSRTSSEWTTDGAAGPWWVSYEFSSPTKVSKYSIESASDGEDVSISAPKDWTLEGSNDGFSWSTIDTRADVIYTSNEQVIEFSLSATAEYYHYRLVVSATKSSTQLKIGAIEYYGEAQADFIALTSDDIEFKGEFEFANISDVASSADTLITSTPIADGDDLVIVLEDNSVNEIVASGVVDNSSTKDTNDIFGDGSIIDTYQFNDSMVSLSGTNNGTGTLSTYEAGQFGDAGSFLGVTGQMDTPISMDTTQSISLWVKISEAEFCRVMGSNSATQDEYINATGGGTFNTTMQGIFAASIQSLILNSWNHIAISYASGEVSLYLNGVFDSSTSGTQSSGTELWAFNQAYSGNTGGSPLIDQTRLFNRGVTQAEVNILYAENISSYTMDTTPTTNSETPSRTYAVSAQPSFDLGSGFVDAVTNTDSYVYVGEQYFVSFTSDTAMTMTPRYTNSGVTLEYSINSGSSWAAIASGAVTSSANEICFRGQATGTKSLYSGGGTGNGWVFTDSTNVVASGNLNYLLCDAMGDAIAPTTLADLAYNYMFHGCASLITAPQLQASAIGEDCYNYMFRDCTSLVAAPYLPATTLGVDCYYYMFYGCTSLAVVSNLPAIAMASRCYGYMFYNCTSLKVSATQTGTYQHEWRIPTTGTGAAASNWNQGMLYNTTGTYTSDPALDTIYWVESASAASAEPVGVYLKATRTYNDLIDSTGSQNIQTKVELRAENDKMTLLQASLMKKT